MPIKYLFYKPFEKNNCPFISRVEHYHLTLFKQKFQPKWTTDRFLILCCLRGMFTFCIVCNEKHKKLQKWTGKSVNSRPAFLKHQNFLFKGPKEMHAMSENITNFVIFTIVPREETFVSIKSKNTIFGILHLYKWNSYAENGAYSL